MCKQSDQLLFYNYHQDGQLFIFFIVAFFKIYFSDIYYSREELSQFIKKEAFPRREKWQRCS